MANFNADLLDVKLREFLLILLNDLTFRDRCQLHFAIGNAVPRRLREVFEIHYTLQIFEHLIETEKIFDSLPAALRMCGRLDWARRLKEFERILKSSSDSNLLEAILNDLTEDTDDD